jgi:hypothetical protein
MADPDKGKHTKPAENLPAMSFSWRMRFSPQVIVFLLMLLAAIPRSKAPSFPACSGGGTKPTVRPDNEARRDGGRVA